jgi:hypothetical protein
MIAKVGSNKKILFPTMSAKVSYAPHANSINAFWKNIGKNRTERSSLTKLPELVNMDVLSSLISENMMQLNRF